MLLAVFGTRRSQPRREVAEHLFGFCKRRAGPCRPAIWREQRLRAVRVAKTQTPGAEKCDAARLPPGRFIPAGMTFHSAKSRCAAAPIPGPRQRRRNESQADDGG